MSLSSAPVETTIVTTADERGYVDWCAIAAGVIVAFAVPLILLSFGSAIGLSLVSPYRGEGISLTFFIILTGLWVALSQISGFLAGGYLSGRLRRRVGDGTPHEVEMRDGMHGLVTWGTTTLIGIAFAAFMAAGLAALGIGAAAATGDAASGTPSAYYVEKLLRPNFAAPGAEGAPTPPAPMAADNAATPNPRQTELSNILGTALTSGTFNDEDRTYAANVIAQETGLTAAEAEARLDQVYAEAKAAADEARQYAVLLAFLTAASLLVGALAAWYAAVMGGDHRDKGTNFSHLARWR